jgi:hypothetical protein
MVEEPKFREGNRLEGMDTEQFGKEAVENGKDKLVLDDRH